MQMPLDDWSNPVYSDFTMNDQTKDTRQHILETGYQLVVEKGFTAVGLSELLKHAGVPKGSFYHYFSSKEKFGEALIEAYFSHYFERLSALLSRSDQSVKSNLLDYWSLWLNTDQGVCGAQKCLVVKLSAEISDLSDPMRLALMNGANRIVSMIAGCIERGKNEGSVADIDEMATAEFLYNQWIGASLMYKLTKDESGLHQALKIADKTLSGELKI